MKRLALAALILLVVACQKKDSDTRRDVQQNTCATAAPLTATKLKGAGMPLRTLAFTFDDGPGPRTVELSHYLKAEGIKAGFFVNGQMLKNTSALAELVADGHVIGNHTQTHADLTSLSPAQIVTELEQTDALIAQFVPDQRFMFRPPYGSYNDAANSALTASAMAKYVGPVDWDIGDRMAPGQAADWACWKPEDGSPPLSPTACGDLYLAEIRAKSNGIVLMHDPYFINDDWSQGGTIDMVQYIVPILKAEGFAFMRVDEVPSVAAVLPPLTSQSPAVAEPSGDSSEPCPPSPQASKGR